MRPYADNPFNDPGSNNNSSAVSALEPSVDYSPAQVTSSYFAKYTGRSSVRLWYFSRLLSNTPP